MNTNPKVSVIVTTSNRRSLLRETILSILNQTYQNFELIIVDNYSDYDFFSFIKEFESDKILPFQNVDRGIIAVNRNYGLSLAKGDFVAFCDDDDLWYKAKLEHQVAYLNENDSVILVSTIAKKIGKSTCFLCKDYGIMYRNINLDSENLIKWNPFVLSSILVKKKYALMIDGFREDESLLAIEDYDFCFRLFEYGKLCVIKKPLVYYRLHDRNISRSKKLERYINFLRINNLRIDTIHVKEPSSSLLMILLKNLYHLLLSEWYSIIFFIGKVFKTSKLSIMCSSKYKNGSDISI